MAHPTTPTPTPKPATITTTTATESTTSTSTKQLRSLLNDGDACEPPHELEESEREDLSLSLPDLRQAAPKTPGHQRANSISSTKEWEIHQVRRIQRVIATDECPSLPDVSQEVPQRLTHCAASVRSEYSVVGPSSGPGSDVSRPGSSLRAEHVEQVDEEHVC
jgi:hypothetical protein